MYQYLLGSENNLPTSEHEVSDVDDYQEYIKMTHNRKSATKINIGHLTRRLHFRNAHGG